MVPPLLLALLLASGQGPARADSLPAITRVAIPGGSGGIGFDDLVYSPELGRVLVPAGGTGALDLIDPATRAITEIPGVAPKSSRPGEGHDQGTTSADGTTAWLVASNRPKRRIELIDPVAKN